MLRILAGPESEQDMHKTYTSPQIFHQDVQESTGQTPAGQTTGKKPRWKVFQYLPNLRTPLAGKAATEGLSSKIIEGVLPALTLLALTLMLDLLIYPIRTVARTEGLFIFFFIVLALGLYSLDRSTAGRSETASRALWGMAAGLFLWHAFWMTQLFADFAMESPGPILILILVTMVGLTLWRPVLPLGVKFFLLSFLASWYSRIFVIEILNLSSRGLIPPGLFYLIGFLALVGLLFCIGYLVYRAEFKIQRYWISLVMWQVTLIGLSVAIGALF